MSTEVRTPDVTGALPPVLRGLAASEASRPVYLPVSVLLSQKAPVAPAVAVTAQQQTPVVMASQAHVQAASQPVQPPQSGIAAAPGAPVVSQVRGSSPFLPPCVAHAPPSRARALSQLPAGGLCHKHNPRYSWPHKLTQLDVRPKSHTCPHTFTFMHSHKCVAAQGHAGADIKAQSHHGLRDTWTRASTIVGKHSQNSNRERVTCTHVYALMNEALIHGVFLFT